MVAALIAVLALAAPPVTHDMLPVYVGPSNRGVDSYEYTWGAGAPHPVSLGVFARPRRRQDAAPPMVRTFARLMRGDLAQSRLLLASGMERIYAFPAQRHQICFMRTPRGGGSCVRSLVHGAYPRVDPHRDVWGLVDDDAVSVDVTVAHRVLHAQLGQNAFFMRLPAHAAVPTRIVVRERNRTRHIFDIERCTPGPRC